MTTTITLLALTCIIVGIATGYGWLRSTAGVQLGAIVGSVCALMACFLVVAMARLP